jgi:hypothetical protein
MAQDNFTKEMLYQLLGKMWADRGYPREEGERIDMPISELVAESVKRSTERELPFVDLWVAILDECIGWWVALALAVYGKRKSENRLAVFERAIVLIINKIIADSTAIRHLILLGFDTSARTILRSVSEYMEVFVAILHTPDFSRDFIKSDTPEAAQEFWEKHLRGGKIRRRVNAAWDDFFGSREKETAEWFANWGRSSNAILSGLTHPSAAGGLFASIPLSTEYSEENWLGIWGEKAEVSANTIFIYTKFMLPALLLSKNFPFGGFEGYIDREYDESDHFHRRVRIGRGVLASLILSSCNEGNALHVMPELDYSIFPEDSEAQGS